MLEVRKTDMGLLLREKNGIINYIHHARYYTGNLRVYPKYMTEETKASLDLESYPLLGWLTDLKETPNIKGLLILESLGVKPIRITIHRDGERLFGAVYPESNRSAASYGRDRLNSYESRFIIINEGKEETMARNYRINATDVEATYVGPDPDSKGIILKMPSGEFSSFSESEITAIEPMSFVLKIDGKNQECCHSGLRSDSEDLRKGDVVFVKLFGKVAEVGDRIAYRKGLRDMNNQLVLLSNGGTV